MTVIEKKLGIPRSTLSGWFKSVEITEEQRLSLMKNTGALEKSPYKRSCISSRPEGYPFA